MLAITEAAGGAHHQPRPHVALHRGHPELEPDLDRTTASASCPGRRRCGSTRAASACPSPLFPGFDTLGTLEHIMRTGYDYTWFVLTQKIIEKEFALSGSEQNPDLTGKSWRQVLGRARRQQGARRRCEAFKQQGADFVVERDAGRAGARHERADATNRCSTWRRWSARSSRATARSTIRSRKDAQITAIRGARRYLGDRLIRTAKPHQLLDPKAGPLIAVRLHILTRKTLGGLETDLVEPRAAAPMASPCRASMPPARWRASAAAACTATARWRGRSSAAASSPAARRAARRRGRWSDRDSHRGGIPQWGRGEGGGRGKDDREITTRSGQRGAGEENVEARAAESSKDTGEDTGGEANSRALVRVIRSQC